MVRSLLALVAALALLSAPARAAQSTEASNDLWRRDGERISFTTARFSFPTDLGGVRLVRAVEFSNPGRGIDSGLQYQSADGTVFATVYVYYPGLSHAGLTAFMTDDAIHDQGSAVRTLADRIVAAGGHDGVAIRIDYSSFRDGLATSAAFIKAGRWIVKLRVSGPEARRAKVETAMAALLDRMRFEGEIRPQPAARIEFGACQATPDGPAHALADDAYAAIEAADMATVDGGGGAARAGRDGPIEAIPARIGGLWCPPTRLRIGDTVLPVLRPRSGETVRGLRTALLVPITDAGKTLELVETEGRFVLLLHNVGRTDILGSYDGPLNDAQLTDLVSGAGGVGGRSRASVEFLTNGNASLNVPFPERTPRPRPQS